MQNMVGVVPNAVKKFWFHTYVYQPYLSIHETKCATVAIINHTQEKLEAEHHKFQRRFLSITGPAKSVNK